MDPIVTEIIEIIKKAADSLSREKNLQIWLTQFIMKKMAKALEVIDNELVKKYKEQGYQVERLDKRSIQCVFGELVYRRRLMKAEGKKSLYPLDKELGIEAYQRNTTYMEWKIAQIASQSTYRNTAAAVDILTAISVSHQTVGKIVEKVGERYAQWQRQSKCGAKKTVRVLCLEGDGIIISGQGKKKREIHRFQVSERVEKNGNRGKLKERYCFAGYDRNQVVRQMKNYLKGHYELSECLVLSNSDGGSGYGKGIFDEIAEGCRRHEHFRDRYHVNQKVKKRMSLAVPEVRKIVERGIQNYDWNEMMVGLDTAECVTEIEDEVRQIEKLRSYIKRNWEYIKPMKKRGLEETGIGIGSCESNHRIYSYRMKKQGRSWGEKGGTGMIHIITGMKNGDLAQAFINGGIRINKKTSRTLQKAVGNTLKKLKDVHIGVHVGGIANYGSSRSAAAHLARIFG